MLGKAFDTKQTVLQGLLGSLHLQQQGGKTQENGRRWILRDPSLEHTQHLIVLSNRVLCHARIVIIANGTPRTGCLRGEQSKPAAITAGARNAVFLGLLRRESVPDGQPADKSEAETEQQLKRQRSDFQKIQRCTHADKAVQR
jgi:hypothetical protein